MRLSRKGWVLLTTVTVIAFIFAFYFLVYVKANESRIVDNKMRVLAQIKSNINHLINSETRIRRNQKTAIQSDNDAQRKAGNGKDFDLETRYPGWSHRTDSADAAEGFSWDDNSATWIMGDGYVYEMDYSDFFGKELIERADVFDFIAIAVYDGKSWKTRYSNFPLGGVNYATDSILTDFAVKNIFEVDFGYGQYLVFNTQLADQGTAQVFLSGYVNKSLYNQEKREVSVFFITAAIIVTTLIILALPLLKLRIMSNSERLGGMDVFLAGASLVIIPAVLILFFFLYTTNISQDQHTEKEKLAALNNKLSDNFLQELENATRQLSRLKSFIPPEFDTGDLDQVPELPSFSPFTHRSNNYFTDVWNNSVWMKDFNYFNSIFWTDDLGNIKIYLSSEKDPGLLGSLRHRSYVTDIVNGKALPFNGEQIAFESIRSVSDGNYEIGLGMDSNNQHLPVLATSFSMVSLMDPILEEGYGFCLFDTEGLTLFHSEIQRNLNEDFLMETGEVFHPYLKSGASHFTSVSYMGKDHYMYLHKISELDGYFLATFLDKSYTYSPNAIALNMTVEMLAAYMAFLLLAYLVLFLMAHKRNKLKQKVFVFYWLKPHTFFKGKSHLYVRLLLVNLLVLVYVLSSIAAYCIIGFSPDLLIHTLISSGLLLIVFNFWLLSQALPENEKLYTQLSQPGASKSMLIIIILYGILLIGGRGFLMAGSFSPVLLVEMLVGVALAFGIYKVITADKKQAIPAKGFVTRMLLFFERRSLLDYKLYICSFILIVSVVPTFAFFSINYNMEKEISFKQNAFLLKEKIDHWDDNKAAQFYKEQDGPRIPIIEPLHAFVAHMRSDDSLAYAIPESFRFLAGSDTQTTSAPDKFYTHLYHQARIEFDRYGLNSQGFIYDRQQPDGLWSFVDDGMNFQTASFPARIVGPIDDFSTLFVQNWWSILLFIVVLAIVLYSLLSSVIHKVFGLDYKDYSDKLILPKNYAKIEKMLQSLYSEANGQINSFNNSFIVGVNASHEFEILRALQQWKKEGFYRLDLMDLPYAGLAADKDLEEKDQEDPQEPGAGYEKLIAHLVRPEGNQILRDVLREKRARAMADPIMIFIEHFEYAYDNERLNRVKLGILQRLVSNPSIRVIISSEISPTKIYEFYEDSLKKAQEVNAGSLENKEQLELLRSDYKQWLHLLGGFYRLTVPLEFQDPATEVDCLQKELKHGQYLAQINYKYTKFFENMDYCEDYILNVQETSYTYYYSIWNSLTKEERYIVYDIAHDQFVNTNNVDGIIDLLHKGLLVYDHSLRLMNESFTNFVLTKVSSDEALERELESAKKGNWSTASSVLLLVITSLIIFISFGKINILEDVNALLGSLIAFLTLLLRMSGIFVTGKAPK